MSQQAMYTFLIVDDNANNLFTLRALLREHLDADVVEAESGMAALEAITQHKIDLILLDIQMPGMDGFEVARLIRNRKRFHDIPIIFLTAVYKSEEFKDKGLAGGAIDYLTKPIDETILINRVKAYLRLLETERESNRQLQQMNAQLQAEIEERVRVERELASERNLLQTLIDHLPDLVYVKDAESRFLLGNTATLRSLGCSDMSALQGKTDFDFHARDMAERYRTDEGRLLDSGRPLLNKEEAIYDQHANATTWLLSSKIPFRDHLGNVRGLVGIGRDITQIKQAEEELQRLNQQLQEASQHKTDFLSSMSHEIRTPLNATIGYVSLALSVLRNTVPVEQLENLIKAERSSRTLLQLINDVLDFSKIEAGKMDVLIEEFDLADLLEDVAITAEGLLLDKPVEIRSDIAEDLPEVESDYTKVKQMLNNIIGNAIKFTSEGYVAVRARTHEHGRTIRIEIEDTGGGIPQEKLATIFESYAQADSSVKKQFGGTGLGLAITKTFCDMLGIEIDVESEVGKGTLFRLHVPVTSTVQDSAAAKRDSQPECAEAFDDARPSYQSVLVVDDEEMNLMLMESVFGLSSYTVYVARSGKEAIEIATARHPDVVLMDMAMPEMDGFEATHALRSNPETADMIIIACSAMATEDVQTNAMQTGCNGFISKPIQPDSLLKKVGDIVRNVKGNDA